NEAETRLRFIDPFFEALGWEIRNPKEVRIESMLARSDSTRPDYRFLIDGKTKFFVEAKKPSVKLTDPAPIFQAKSYGFSSKVPIVILTDFEEFRPFRTLARPKFDRPLDGLIKEFDFTYERYVDEFDTLHDIFSREAVGSGALEKHIPVDKKEASKTVDKEFLVDLSAWQEELAKNIALRNSTLSVGEINEAVQRILDRMIFLRICEDRQIEESEILLSYKDKEDIYKKLLKEFARLRAKYNGLIFNEHKLTENLAIDDKLLKDIIKNLYLPYSPYRFNEIPIEILGTIYEQYLGKVITLTPTHRAKVDVKPEVRKAGGVFYTPQFITSYIVKNTIGKLLEPCEGSEPSQGLSPEQISKLKFADIACGSGSFLLEMFDYLIRYHIDYYSSNPDAIKTIDGIPDAYQDALGLWHLSTRKKKDILLNNIYGVDIDPQAVEVTQMSLYLKLLEGENAESFDKQLTLELKETILPTLSNNIKCGNSLVGMDVKGLGNNLTLEEELRIRPFDWETAFPQVFTTSVLRTSPPYREGVGFDAIVGNPPYIRIQTMKEWTPLQVEYFKSRYKSASKGNYDIYVVFVERALSLLNKNGKLGYILPHKFFNAQYGEPLRNLISKGKHLSYIVHFGDQQIFEGATTYTCLLFLDKAENDEFTFTKVDDLRRWQISGKATEALNKSEGVNSSEWNFAVGEGAKLFEKLKKYPTRLNDIAHLFVGLQTDADDVFIVEKIREEGKRILCYSKATSKEHWFELEHPKPFLKGSLNIRRYALTDVNKLLIFPYEIQDGKSVLISKQAYERRFPYTWEYLIENRKRLSARNKGRMGNEWYGYVYKKNHTRFGVQKLLVPSLATGSCFSIDVEGIYYFVGSGGGGGGGYAITLNPDIKMSYLYLLGILNSDLLNSFLKRISTTFRGGYIALNRQYIEQLPIHAIDFNNPEEKSMHDRMVQLVERMLDLHKKKHQSKAESEKELFEHQIKATDREIDELVFRLYGLTEEEIKLVEGKDK
ncbi:MAG: restriction endonuclease subunit M, partial [Chlorobiaceae bacterium]|nr:restriction endonuclease subunit M [Chlorobiaceae bacterium]